MVGGMSGLTGDDPLLFEIELNSARRLVKLITELCIYCLVPGGKYQCDQSETYKPRLVDPGA